VPLAAKKHKQLKEKLVINFDCVGEGDNFVIATKKADVYMAALTSAFAANDKFAVTFIKGAKAIPSDHIKFKCSAGVGAFVKKGESLSLKIKNNGSDTVCNDENIEFACKSGINALRYYVNPSLVSADRMKAIDDMYAAGGATVDFDKSV
jgi:hypothetical protein